MLAGLLALNTVSTDAFGGPPRNGGKSGSIVRVDVRAKVGAKKKQALRSVTGAQFAAEAKADAKKLLAELRIGLKITEVNTLGKDAITGTTAVLETVSAMVGGNLAGVRLRLKKNNQLTLRIGKATAAQPATTPTTTATEQPAEASEDEDEDE
jgi:hypothetical protein